MLKDRQKSILNAVVHAHVKMARPIASQDLAGRVGFRLSSATIRNEMLELDERGFLEQPYTSAGRVPTDTGYRFFVDNLLDEILLRPQEKKLLHDAFGVRHEEEFVRELARALSAVSGAFAAAGLRDEEAYYDTGFSQVLDEPEFSDTELVRDFGHLIDSLEETLRSFAEEKKESNRVYIGSENPLRDGRKCTMIISEWRHTGGAHGYVAIVGPRRMNYSKNLALLDYIGEFNDSI